MNGKISLLAKNSALFIQNFLFAFGNFFANLQKVPLYAQILFVLCVLLAICLVILICVLCKNKKNQKKEKVIKADISEKSLKEIEKIVKVAVSENDKKNENSHDFSENLENSEIEELEELPETRKTLPEETGLQSAFIEELEEIPETLDEREHRGIDLESYEKHESSETGDVNYTPSNAVDSSKFEGTEPLVLGDETKNNLQKSEKVESSKEFKIFTPFDYKAENLANSENEQNNKNTEITKEPAEENVAPLEELSANADKDGFMFTTFCANDNNVTDLPIEAIVLGEDGVFQISSNISSTNVPIDEDFKKLVDSVLH